MSSVKETKELEKPKVEEVNLLADIKKDKDLQKAIKADKEAMQSSSLFEAYQEQYKHLLLQRSRIVEEIDKMKAKGKPKEGVDAYRMQLWKEYHIQLEQKDEEIKAIKVAVASNLALMDTSKLN